MATVSRRLAITVAVAALSTGCGLGLMAPVVVEGQAFRYQHIGQLRRLMTTTEVEALLGAPLRDVREGDTRVWTYDERRQRRECRPILFGIALGPARTDRQTLELTFGSRGLEHAVYRTVTSDGSSERVVVPG